MTQSYSSALQDGISAAKKLCVSKGSPCYVVKSKATPRARKISIGHCFNLHNLLKSATTGIVFKNNDGSVSEIVAVAKLDENGVIQLSK